MGAGAQIIVTTGRHLIMDSTNIEGCTNMWRNIFVQREAKFETKRHTSISDADHGVWIGDSTFYVKIDNTIFFNCIRGIYIPPMNSSDSSVLGSLIVKASQFSSDSHLKPPFTGQATIKRKPYAGIDVTGMIGGIGVIGAGTNQFNNLSIGIIARRSNLLINNCQFTNIKTEGYAYSSSLTDGTAIVSTGILGTPLVKGAPGSMIINNNVANSITINNCWKGIYSHYSTLKVSNTQIEVSYTAIESDNCTDQLYTFVLANDIVSQENGIKWSNNVGAKSMTAENNNITINGHQKGDAIHLSEVIINMDAHYQINQNHITVKDALNGITANVVYR